MRLEAPAATVRRRLSGLRPSMVAMVVLTLAASAVNYGSALIFSRILTPASFGDLTALLALAVVIAVPTGAAQTVVAARVAGYAQAGDDARIHYLVRHAIFHVGVIATIVTLLYTLAIPFVERALDLQAIGPAIALAPLIWQTFLVPVVLGVLQGFGRFVAFGCMSLCTALARPVFGVPWAEAGGGAGGALAGQALGGILAVVVALYLLREWWPRTGSGAGKAGALRAPSVTAVVASAAFIAFAVISNFDIVLAKLFMEPVEAGRYAALATIAKILIFLPGAVAVALVPSAARAGSDLAARTRALRLAALAVFAATLLVAVPAVLAPEMVLGLMFGEAYEAAADGVVPMVFAGTGLALLYLLVVYSVTIEDRRWVALLVLGVVLQSLGIAAFHDSPSEVAAVQAVVVGVLLVINEARFHSLLRRARPS